MESLLVSQNATACQEVLVRTLEEVKNAKYISLAKLEFVNTGYGVRRSAAASRSGNASAELLSEMFFCFDLDGVMRWTHNGCVEKKRNESFVRTSIVLGALRLVLVLVLRFILKLVIVVIFGGVVVAMVVSRALSLPLCVSIPLPPYLSADSVAIVV